MDYKKITTWEQVCQQKGIDSKLPSVAEFPKELQKYITACYQAVIITEVINEGWRPDYTDNNQTKYELWNRIKADKKNRSGFGFSRSLSLNGYSYTISGSRLCFQSHDKAMHAVENFEEVFVILKTHKE